MKKIVLFFIVAFSISVCAQETGIKFSNESLLSQALTRSKSEGKLIFIDCYTSWCGPCKYLVKNIFPQKEVGDFYNSHFINLSFDMEKGEGTVIAAKYGIKAYPTLLFLNADGEIVHIGIGSMEASALIELGKTALDDTQNVRSIQKKIKAGDKSIPTLLHYLNTNYYAADKDVLLNECFNAANDEERLSKDAWHLFRMYVKDIEQPQFQFFLSHRSTFEQKYGKMEVDKKIMDGFGYYADKYRNDPGKAALVKSIDPELYAKYSIKRGFRDAGFMLQDKNADKKTWENYMAKAKAYMTLDSVGPHETNDICWKIYENYLKFNDTASLKLAKDWQEKAYKALPDNHPINDTYAHILFGLGFVKEAIEHEEMAMKVAAEMKSEKDLKFYTDEIEIFKKALNKNL